MTRTDFGQALRTIQMEFVEMPELKLTLGQAGRLWALPLAECQAAMAALVASGFLVQARDGAYLRRGTPPVSIESLDSLTWKLT
jgi:hypothetical protein